MSGSSSGCGAGGAGRHCSVSKRWEAGEREYARHEACGPSLRHDNYVEYVRALREGMKLGL